MPEKGPGVDLPTGIGIQKYEKTSELMNIESRIVKEKSIEALRAGIDKHGWNVDSFRDLSYEQRARAIFEWIQDHMGYLNDSPKDENSGTCGNEAICKCVNGYRCSNKEGGNDIFLSAKEILIETQDCCRGNSEGTIKNYDYFGDCDDHAILFASMLRAVGASEHCVAISISDSHAFNTIKLNGKWEYIETSTAAGYKISWENMLKPGIAHDCQAPLRGGPGFDEYGFNDYYIVGRCDWKD